MRTTFFTFAILLFIVAACTNGAPTITPTTPTATVTVSITLSPTSTKTPTDTASPTPPAATETATAEPTAAPASEPQWFVRVEDVPEWPEDGSYPYWVDSQTISFQWVWEKNIPVINITESGVGPLLMPELPAYLNDVDQYSYVYSPNKTYVAVCGDRKDKRYHELMLYRTVDGQRIGHIDNIVFDCWWSIAWADDESALSFYDDQYEKNQNEWMDIYVWNTDGSLPYVIGKGNLQGPAHWSPDGKRLVIEIYNPDPPSPDYEHTYQILYRDGRPQKETRGQCGVRSETGLYWLTNDVVLESNSCCGSCGFWTYYVAETGEQIPDIYWTNCFPVTPYDTQRPVLSPNQRWFMVDRTDQNFIDITIPFNYTYTLYDFQTYQPYIISESPDTLLNFIGWTPDSAQFLLIRRPITDTVTEQPDAPFGLLSLNPFTRQLTLVDPTFQDAWLSPDGNYLFGVSDFDASDGIRYGAIYTLDGRSVTPLQPITDQTHSWDLQDFGETGNLRFTWSNDSTQVAFRDEWGAAWLAGVDGQIRPLAAGLPGETSESKTFSDELFIWSPDDSHLLVRSDERAWVAYLPQFLRPDSPITLTALRMIDESAGWGLNENGHILRTRDAGATWQNVSPSTDFFLEDGFFALDADTAWATFKSWCGAYVGDCGGSDQYVKTATVWRTTDGGQTWQASQPFTLGNSGSRPELAYYPHLYFADDQNGWLLAWLYASHMGQMYKELFQTTDGGQTWQVAADDLMPIMGAVTQIAFRDGQTGWALEMGSYDFEGVAVYQTTDGGKSWLGVANSVADSGLRLFCSGGTQASAWPHLILQSDCTNLESGAPLSITYFTPDGGESWQFWSGVSSLDWLTSELGLRLTAGNADDFVLEKTTDGGLTWVKVKTVTWSGQLDFVSEQVGWAIARQGDAVALVFTIDGGKTWAELHPVVSP
jgi:photosystem II stability/assembly factor-like uncharacterized protein